jgi:folate-dependent phosphoribosylglycinamide formyltransferase PurN
VCSDVALLGVRGESTNAIFHALSARFGRPHVILEDSVSRVQLARRRARKLGWMTVSGQVLFAFGIVPLLSVASRKRREAIGREHGLDLRPIDGSVIEVRSVNSDEARQALVAARPGVVVVSGTRIISQQTLVPAPFVNLHAGITPRYRGVHGGYWALVDRRPDLVGSTVHLVDLGVDTGAVVEQVTFPVTPEDSFATLPLRHLAAGAPALLRAVEAALAGTLSPRAPMVQDSGLHYHPTAWGYLWRRLTIHVA